MPRDRLPRSEHGILSEEGLSEATIDHTLAQPDARIHRPIERGRPFSAFSRVWKELGLERETVALILGISDRTLHRREHQDKRLSQPEADRAFRLARLFAHGQSLARRPAAGHAAER